jgi:DNA-binding transcriptional regulator YiaG
MNRMTLVYTLKTEINPRELSPKYPKNPQTLGERLRKARMDKGMTLKEAAALFGVSETAVLNWEIRGKMPEKSRMKKVTEFLAKEICIDNSKNICKMELCIPD